MTTPPNATGDNPSESNPFKRLFKMSTTAGVGTHDYVAVNTPAVVAVLAGLASFTVLFSNVMFVIPAFTIIVGLIAMSQIRRSSGTQTGLPLAVAGMVLALGFSTKVIYDEYAAAQQFKSSKAKIGTIFGAFSKAAAAGQYGAAYDLFTPGFKREVSFERFEGEFKQVEAGPGRVSKVEWNQRLESVPDPSGGKEYARAIVQVVLADGKALEATPVMSRSKDQDWMLESFNPLFQSQPPPNAGGGRQPPPGP